MRKDLKIIYHHSGSLNNRSSGSGIRPIKMLEALQNIGCEVDTIAGLAEERKLQTAQLKQRIRDGEHFDFLYFENRTVPLELEIRKLPFSPVSYYGKQRVDKDFILFCRQQGIPVFYFFRDIYFDFEEAFASNYFGLKKKVILTMQKKYGRRELRFIRDNNIQLLVPSKPFADYVFQTYEVSSIPLSPGSVPQKSLARSTNSPLKLFYVGGVSSMYISDFFLEELKRLPPHVELHLCCRKAEWESQQERLKGIPNVFVYHYSGKELETLYLQVDLALFPLKPSGYGAFSYSLKIPEYICHSLPIIALKGTICGDIIEEHQVGWAINETKGALLEVLNVLEHNQDELIRKKQALDGIKEHFSWSGVAHKLLEIAGV